MPGSLGRHNLARIRKHLKLTQSDVAKLVGCAQVTIKSVETGRLQLSESLALRINHALGIMDRDWLLKNDLNAPLPKRFEMLKQDSESDKVTANHVVVLMELFSRLFGVVATMEKGNYRRSIEMYIDFCADALRRTKKPDTNGGPFHLAGSKAIELFVRHPVLFNPNLRSWVNLKGLLRANLERSTPWADAPGQIDERAREAEENLQEALRLKDSSELSAQPPKPRRRSAPGQTRASPAPADQRKNSQSSPDQRAATR